MTDRPSDEVVRPNEIADAFRARLYRIVFLLAGCYNLAFGLWAGLRPRAFFNLIEIEPPRYPALWACLGMVVGVYGFLYLHAAWRLERARPIIAIGLLGKILGPIGAAVTAGTGELPPRILSLLVLNDVIWWLPFAMFLLERTRIAERIRASAPLMCAAIHAVSAGVLLFALRAGTQVEPEPMKRADFIVQNLVLWRIGWAVWMAAALSTLGLYAWWAARIRAQRWAIVAVLAAAAGVVCDLSGESILVAWLPDRAAAMLNTPDRDTTQAFINLERGATIATAIWANGLYVLGGVILTLAAKSLRGWFLGLTWCIWFTGAGMSVAAAFAFVPGIVITSGVLFPLFIIWCVMLARRFR